ncbi:MAG: polymorphic toxin-type HINT domain-containing protein, partial [Candidatus Omnitrophica bacterium]|nr:polymorphic toxin-type HINT domain-containing protein [Candidatus Omnitrophota bacterium]
QKTFSDGTLPVNYTYDDAAVPNSKGRLTKANYQLTANTNFVYDELGREVKSTKKIESSDYEVQRSYDAAGRLLSVKYPDNESVFYSYNRSGQVEQVAGSPIATDTQTKLLLHVDGADGSTSFRDDSLANHSIAAFGNVQLDTSQSKFGGSSALFDGNGDYLSISDSSNWNFGSEDFTIDFWARFESLSGDPKMIIHQQDYDTTTWYVMYYPPTHAVHFLFLKDNVAELSLYKELELSLATWYHFAFVKSGTTAYMFINGSLIMSDSCSASLNNFSSNLAIGSHVFGTMMFFDGELDEFRISKGIARWTSNFTPPNEPYSIVSGDVQYYVSNGDYNASGQITRIEYGNGDITEYTYDPLNLRLTHLVTTSPASGIIQDLSYQYDSAGNILQIIDNVNTGSQTFQYDELSRLVVASGSYGTEYFDYDEIGNITLKDGVIYSYGAGLAGPHAVTSGSDGSIFSYDANGNMVSMTKGSINTRYEYDAENRLKSVIKNNQALASFAYDGDGGRTKKTLYKYSGGGGCFLAGTPILMADGSTKPIEKVKVGDEVLSFDENKNLLVADTVKQAFIHKANEYFILNGSLRVTGEHPFYSNGEWIKVNELKIGDSIKDKEGNLKKITDIQKVKADVLVYNLEVNPYHTYFADGFLVHNKLPMRMFNDTGSGDNYGILENEKPSQLRYVFEFLSSLLEPTVAEAATVTEIPTIFVGSLYEKTSGSPTKHIFLGSQRIASITNSQVNYYHTDHLGSTNVITNEAGNQIALYEYKPYGEFSRKEEASADPTEYFFTGKKLDDETGLYYYGARYYNPLIGRFITPDTIVQAPANPQSLNRYAYCGNNPINVIDPTGHWSWKKFWHSFAGAFVGAVVTVLTAGWGAPLWLAGMAGGFFGGALTGGLEGGGMGALYGGLIGGALGGLGGWGLGIAQSHQMAGQYAAGLLIVGAGTSAASDNWDRFAGGLAGGIAGAIVGNGIDSYFHEGISSRTTQSTDSAMQEQAQRNVRMLGIGTTDQKAQAAANAKNATVFYTKSRGYASDFVRAGIQKVFHNSLASRQFAANYLRGASNINIYAHSEGSLTLAGAIKSLNVDGVKVIGVNIDFRGPVIMESTARTLATSIGATYTYQLNIGDPVGIFATVNPVMLGLYGAIGIPTLATFHSTDYY